MRPRDAIGFASSFRRARCRKSLQKRRAKENHQELQWMSPDGSNFAPVFALTGRVEREKRAGGRRVGDGGVVAGGRVGRKDIQLIRFVFFISSCSICKLLHRLDR